MTGKAESRSCFTPKEQKPLLEWAQASQAFGVHKGLPSWSVIEFASESSCLTNHPNISVG
jgi:hypothetical protein